MKSRLKEAVRRVRSSSPRAAASAAFRRARSRSRSPRASRRTAPGAAGVATEREEDADLARLVSALRPRSSSPSSPAEKQVPPRRSLR